MYNRYSESLLQPHLFRIKDNLILAKFELMKILPAKHIIETALHHGQVNPEVPVIETSSGTFALGLGIVCAELGIPFFIVSDPAIDNELQQRLNQLGGTVQILTEALTRHNPQQVRLDVLQDYLRAQPQAFWTRQYDNLDNQNSYAPFADYLVSKLGKDLTIVAAVGSGGSSCGTIKRLREINPSVRLVGVDTFGSVLFGLPNQQRVLRGLGNSLLPKNLNHEYFDQVHWVNANDTFRYTRKLHAEKALFCGATTGATYQVAEWISQQHPDELVVFIGADTGHRYQNSIYNDNWLANNQLTAPATTQPTAVTHPHQAQHPWCYINWHRRYYHEVMETA